MIDLKGKTALVTGGGRGIGRAISLALASVGANLLVGYKDNYPSEVISLTNGHYSFSKAIQFDIRNRRSVKEALSKEKQQIEILINNAGINYPVEFDAMLDADFDNVIETNLKGSFIVTQEARYWMVAGASIINISSISAALGGPISVHYAASKAGLESMTRGLAKQLAKDGIRVNCVAPGYVQSEMADKGMENEAIKSLVDSIPLGRLATPEDVANAVLWLASDMSSYVTGQVIHVSGGLWMA